MPLWLRRFGGFVSKSLSVLSGAAIIVGSLVGVLGVVAVLALKAF